LERQRIDKWLWCAHVVRTRAAAAALAAGGRVRVNGQRINAASRAVRRGDVITVALDRTVRVLKVVGFADRRGPAQAAFGLSEPVVTGGGDRSTRPEPPPHPTTVSPGECGRQSDKRASGGR
jgi:ribosome-associated heat shock protein Hsp15